MTKYSRIDLKETGKNKQQQQEQQQKQQQQLNYCDMRPNHTFEHLSQAKFVLAWHCLYVISQYIRSVCEHVGSVTIQPGIIMISTGKFNFLQR